MLWVTVAQALSASLLLHPFREKDVAAADAALPQFRYEQQLKIINNTLIQIGGKS